MARHRLRVEVQSELCNTRPVLQHPYKLCKMYFFYLLKVDLSICRFFWGFGLPAVFMLILRPQTRTIEANGTEQFLFKTCLKKRYKLIKTEDDKWLRKGLDDE